MFSFFVSRGIAFIKDKKIIFTFAKTARKTLFQTVIIWAKKSGSTSNTARKLEINTGGAE